MLTAILLVWRKRLSYYAYIVECECRIQVRQPAGRIIEQSVLPKSIEKAKKQRANDKIRGVGSIHVLAVRLMGDRVPAVQQVLVALLFGSDFLLRTRQAQRSFPEGSTHPWRWELSDSNGRLSNHMSGSASAAFDLELKDSESPRLNSRPSGSTCLTCSHVLVFFA